MRTVALEEHFAVPALSARIAKDIINRRGYRPRNLTPGAPNPLEFLPEIGEIRLKSMNDTGITVQVLSNSGPGPDLLPAPMASRSRASSTIIWPPRSRGALTALPVSLLCRCKVPTQPPPNSSAP